MPKCTLRWKCRRRVQFRSSPSFFPTDSAISQFFYFLANVCKSFVFSRAFRWLWLIGVLATAYYHPCLKGWSGRRMLEDEEGRFKRKFRFSATFSCSVKQDAEMDREALPKVMMPNRNGFFPARPEWKRGYCQPYFTPEPIPRVKKP